MKARIVFQPEIGDLKKLQVGRHHRRVRGGFQLPEKGPAGLVQGLPFGVPIRQSALCLFRRQPALLHQPVQVDQVRTARVDRKRLVGTAIRMGGAQRQHLPDPQSRIGDEVDKAPRVGPKIAAVTGAGQAGRVQ